MLALLKNRGLYVCAYPRAPMPGQLSWLLWEEGNLPKAVRVFWRSRVGLGR